MFASHNALHASNVFYYNHIENLSKKIQISEIYEPKLTSAFLKHDTFPPSVGNVVIVVQPGSSKHFALHSSRSISPQDEEAGFSRSVAPCAAAVPLGP